MIVSVAAPLPAGGTTSIVGDLQSVASARHLFLLAGVVLLGVVVVDILWTTLWTDGGAGPLSSRLTAGTWHGLRRAAGESSRLLDVAGPIVLVVTLAAWMGLLVAGWTLVFAGGEALVDTRTHGPVGWVDRVYVVSYVVFTLGIGDFVPTHGDWQLVTALATASGMLFVTMGVTYVLSVIGATVEKRSFASDVIGLGDRSEEFVRAGWNGEDFHDLDLRLDTLASELGHLAKQHKAYPILHYYHSRKDNNASAAAVAILDESLTVLDHGVPEERRPNGAVLMAARSSVSDYLKTLESAYIRPAETAPPPPDIEALRRANVPTVTDAEFDRALESLDDRRRELRGLTDADARDWPSESEDRDVDEG